MTTIKSSLASYIGSTRRYLAAIAVDLMVSYVRTFMYCGCANFLCFDFVPTLALEESLMTI